METALWISIGIILYTFAGYGVLVSILASFKKKQKYPVLDNEDLPEVTLLVAAYNEEEIIEDKIKNCMALDYPDDKLNILIVTDGSTDGTNKIVQQYPNIELSYSPPRKGKIAALNRVMRSVNTPITIFSDANVMINKNGLRSLVNHFQSNLVGAVSGEKKVLRQKSDGSSATGEGFYWKYESYLKRKDAEWNSLVGSAGEFFAIRTHLYKNIKTDTLIEDFVMTMELASDGYRVAYEPQSIASETASANIEEETKRKVRIAAGGIQAIARLKGLLNPIKFSKLTFQYVSHRVLRWTLMPLSLIAAFVLSIVLCDAWHYEVLFRLQVIFYLLATVGYGLRNQSTQIKLFYIPYYFTYMHVCVTKGWVKYLSGKQQVTWDKAKRVVSSELHVSS